jgi:hypothetical protein
MQIVFEFQSAFTDMQRREGLVSQSGSRRNPVERRHGARADPRQIPREAGEQRRV